MVKKDELKNRWKKLNQIWNVYDWGALACTFLGMVSVFFQLTGPFLAAVGLEIVFLVMGYRSHNDDEPKTHDRNDIWR